jgi:LysM repeat protein
MKKIILSISCLLICMLLHLSSAHAAGSNYSNLYDVKPGDNLWLVGINYGTTVEDLKATNGLQSDLLMVGQKLFVPTWHKVVAGDTLWKISLAFNSTIERIKTANKLSSDSIYVGQQLKIPPKKLPMQGQYVLLTKEEFKDWLFHNIFTRKIKLIQEHHTYMPSYKNFNGSNHFSMLKGMESYHVQEMGWKTISQNLTTFPDGKIAICRPINIAPEGSFGFKNLAARDALEAGSLTIENVGNFDIGGDVMTERQKETIVYVAALLCLKFGLTPSIDTIGYHHWYDMNTAERVLDNSVGHSVKTCPGTRFFGGNSTTSAKNNFYPLVIRKMQEIAASMR